jgi:ketosteroid isomerase-like protein
VTDRQIGRGSAAGGWLIEAAWRSPRVLRAIVGASPPSLYRRIAPAFVRRGYQEFNSRGTVPRELFADEFELYQAAELLGTVGTFRGRDALDRVLTELRDAFADVHFDPQAMSRVDNHRFVFVVQFAGRGIGSGIAVDRPIAHVWTVERNRATRLEVYWEPAEAFEAVGLAARH